MARRADAGGTKRASRSVGRRTRTSQKQPALPARDVMVLTELEQIKVLADPLRIRILEELCEERTTKQVAQRLGEKPTKLYHHVEALQRVGLIALARTRPNRGTLEKYYQAVARSFRADSSAFSAASGLSEEESQTYRDVVRTIFDSTSAELARLIDEGASDAVEKSALLSFLEIRAEEKEIAKIHRRLNAFLKSLASPTEEPDAAAVKQLRYRLTLAFYPLDATGNDAPAPRRAAKGRRVSRKK